MLRSPHLCKLGFLVLSCSCQNCLSHFQYITIVWLTVIYFTLYYLYNTKYCQYNSSKANSYLCFLGIQNPAWLVESLAPCVGVLVSECVGVPVSECVGVPVSECVGVPVGECVGVPVSECVGVLCLSE